jgi:tetratricopeptide (TPR) repeat protein
VAAGKLTEALNLLAKIPPAELKRPVVAKDVEFYAALASARQALAGSGSIAEAGKKMFAFEKENRDSYHYFEACETVGDLLVALGNFPVAESFYNKLAEAPWPAYQNRAGVLVGRALVGQKKFPEAVARFDAVLANPAEDSESQAQKVAAKLGKASALSAQGKVTEAVPLVEEVIEKANPADEDLHARAYNILGNCYRAANQPKQAILAFLHTDLLYPTSGAQHAEALAQLADLFAADNKPERAAQARALLKDKYPESSWAKQ